MGQNKTDEAWEKLFNEHDIVQKIKNNGFFEIQAAQIKKVREPRLMAKFDHASHLPKLFKDNNLSILPVSRSSYVIGDFNVYNSVSYKELKPIEIKFPSNITTIDPTNLYSESSALHCAHVTGMLDQVLGEQSIQTVSGRMSSKEFNFNIHTRKGNIRNIQIKNSQIEIDGGYESQKRFMLVEAKNEKVTDFLVRQIYYPYRLWKDKTQKQVIPVFFTLSNDIFSFFIYKFTDPMNYNSLELVQQKDFIIAHEKLTLEDIMHIFNTVDLVAEPSIPFPQADSFVRIVDLLGLLVNKDRNKDEITSNYSFDERQTSYYTNAGIYLGLIEKYRDENREVMFTLTENARKIMRLKTKDKFLGLAREILKHEPFKLVFSEYISSDKILQKSKVIDIMKKCALYNVSSSTTYERRASTVLGWVKWIGELPDTY